ncbi:hypothetical protein QBC35DRAFT_478692 [Podospora australis]|uniref:Uncharacterized protein n=1 Tax=Podospora australis TaxID=1536484 RepID=A0AAN6WK57_9PEZI|nr:hypothetical protein QBC35DRAFT_478692 [Podospora australis]
MAMLLPLDAPLAEPGVYGDTTEDDAVSTPNPAAVTDAQVPHHVDQRVDGNMQTCYTNDAFNNDVTAPEHINGALDNENVIHEVQNGYNCDQDDAVFIYNFDNGNDSTMPMFQETDHFPFPDLEPVATPNPTALSEQSAQNTSPDHAPPPHGPIYTASEFQLDVSAPMPSVPEQSQWHSLLDNQAVQQSQEYAAEPGYHATGFENADVNSALTSPSQLVQNHAEMAPGCTAASSTALSRFAGGYAGMTGAAAPAPQFGGVGPGYHSHLAAQVADGGRVLPNQPGYPIPPANAPRYNPPTQTFVQAIHSIQMEFSEEATVRAASTAASTTTSTPPPADADESLPHLLPFLTDNSNPGYTTHEPTLSRWSGHANPVPAGVATKYWKALYNRADTSIFKKPGGPDSNRRSQQARESGQTYKGALARLLLDIAKSGRSTKSVNVTKKRRCLRAVLSSLSPDSPLITWLRDAKGIILWNTRWGASPGGIALPHQGPAPDVDESESLGRWQSNCPLSGSWVEPRNP